MSLNEQRFYINRKLFANEEGNEDILYWLSKLLSGVSQLNRGRDYEIQLLQNIAQVKPNL